MRIKRKTVILFLLVLSFLVTSCKSNENNYPDYSFYNTVSLDNQDDLEIDDTNIDIDFKENNNSFGKYQNSFALKNNSNIDKAYNLSNLLIEEYDNIMQYNWDNYLKIIVNGNPISYKVSPGKYLDKLPSEDIDFKDMRKDIINLDYKPKNFDLDTIIYKYKISVSDTDPKLEFIKNNSEDSFVVYTYQDSDYKKNKSMNISENGSVFSYKYPLEEIKINKEVVNKDTKKINNDVDIEIIEGNMTMREFIDSVFKDKSQIEKNMVMEYLDNFLENDEEKNLNIINLLYDAFQKERAIFIDYEVNIPAKSSVNIDFIYPLEKKFEITNSKKINLDIFSNPDSIWENSNNFKLNLKLSDNFSKIKESNIDLKEEDSNIFTFEKDNLINKKINIIFGK